MNTAEVESVETTEELAEFLPRILAPVYDHLGRAVAFIDPAVDLSVANCRLSGSGELDVDDLHDLCAKFEIRHTQAARRK